MAAEGMDHLAFSMLDFFSESKKEVRECAAKQPSAPVPLSLKTRESSALSLKHIFDQIHSCSYKSYAVKSGGVEASSENAAAFPLQNDNVSCKPSQEDTPTHHPDFYRFATKSRSSAIASPPFFTNDSSGKATLPIHMESLPQAVHRCEQSSSSNAQMTIFYSGTVNVYDNVPADKANAIMLLAQPGNSSSPNMLCQQGNDENGIISAPAPLVPMHSSSLNTTGTDAGFSMLSTIANSVSNTVSISSPFDSFLADANLPITPRPIGDLKQPRKASLTRFLEKRKERMNIKLRRMGHQKNGELNLDENHTISKKPCISVLSEEWRYQKNGELKMDENHSNSKKPCISVSLSPIGLAKTGN